jgi:putative tryptophan/tyrosine transport system substrate-binding protein
MRRREFIAFLGGGVMWPVAARARLQEVCSIQNLPNENFEAFVQGLGEAGYVDGRTISLENRFHRGSLEQIDAFAGEFAARNCSVIVAIAPYAIQAVLRSKIAAPVVGIDLESDPVASGWAKSIARPGGNFTGFFLDIPELAGKQVELLTETLPSIKRLAVLWDATVGGTQFLAMQSTVLPSGVSFESFPIRHVDDINYAVERAARAGVNGLVVLTSPLIFNQLSQIADLAAKAHLPTISLFDAFPKAGGFLAYGPNLSYMFKQAAGYVSRILGGEKAGELPIERPSKFELVVNMPVAKRLGVSIPPRLLALATQVIE